MEGKIKSDGSLNGFFVVLDDEEKTEIKNTKKANRQRAGVFYEEKDLIDTISQQKCLKGKKVLLVEVNIPNPHKSVTSPNHKKFSIKCGQGIPVTKYKDWEIIQI